MLQRLFIFLLLFLVLPDLYLYLRFIVRLTAKWWLRVLYWVPSFLLTAGLLYLVYFANNAFAERHTQDIGWFSIIFFLLQLPNCCWSYLPYSESLFINGFAGRAHRLYAPD